MWKNPRLSKLLPYGLAAGLLVTFAAAHVSACEHVSLSVAQQLRLNGPSLNVLTADFDGDSHADVAATDGDNVIVYLGNGAGGFGVAHTSRTGALPGDLASGDFDEDGKTDLAVANYDNISILLNEQAGEFAPPVNYPADGSPVSIGVGDFNRDGHSDLAVANGLSNVVSVLLGDGAGHFGPPENFPAGDHPVSVAVADLTGDQIPDLAVSTYNSQEVIILVGDGDGHFASRNSYPLPGNASNVVIADFNKDERLDFAVGVYNIYPDNRIAVFLGDGVGNFAQVASIPAFDPVGILASDLDGDGNSDLAAALYTVPGLTVALGDGMGAFRKPQYIPLPHNPLPFELAAADFNEDNQIDLAVANYNRGNVSILLNLPIVQLTAVDPIAIRSENNRAHFEVNRIGCTDQPLLVEYSVTGSALPGVDYRPLSGMVTIPAGRMVASIPIVPLGDDQSQNGVTVLANLISGNSYAVGERNSATVTIQNER